VASLRQRVAALEAELTGRRVALAEALDARQRADEVESAARRTFKSAASKALELRSGGKVRGSWPGCHAAPAWLHVCCIAAGEVEWQSACAVCSAVQCSAVSVARVVVASVVTWLLPLPLQALYTDPGNWGQERPSSPATAYSEGGMVSPRGGQAGRLDLQKAGSGDGRSLGRIASLLEARRRPA
jgi:hypothetical protein